MVRCGRGVQSDAPECINLSVTRQAKMNFLRLYVHDVQDDDSLWGANVIGAETNVNVRATRVPSAV